MSNLIEVVIDKHLPHQPEGYIYRKLEGGISGRNYKVEPIYGDILQNAMVVTVIQDPSQWWRIKQEQSFREAVQEDSEVLIPQLFDMGFDVIDGQKYAFLLREYVAGKDLDTILELELKGDDRSQDVKDLTTDLGYRLAVLHRHKASVYGFLGKTESTPFSDWGNYILNELETESKLIGELPAEKEIGYVKAAGLLELLPGLHKSIGSLQSSLSTVDSPFLSHGDARFANFIAGINEYESWMIKGMIDLDEAVGGDPGIDIAFMENWLHFSPYKEDFYKNSSAFKAGYNKVSPISPQYPERRLIYHALRSMAYMRTVFGFDTEEFLRTNPKNSEYVKKHFDILKSLANGYALEDLEIHSLM